MTEPTSIHDSRSTTALAAPDREVSVRETFGIDIAQARTVVVKSRGHFRGGFDEFFAPEQIYEVDCPGLTSPILKNFTWSKLPRPVYPLDEHTTWTPPTSV